MTASLGGPVTACPAGCHGVSPLTARLEPWHRELLDHPDLLAKWLAHHGSPLNLIHPDSMAANSEELSAAAAEHGIELGIHFARKANKALALVDEAKRLGLGVDLASERELAQALDRGVYGGAMVMTAAVKPRSLLELCVSSGTTVVLDNADEVAGLADVAGDAGRNAAAAIRLAPDLGADRPPTRFGFTADEALEAFGRPHAGVRVDGVHFHLDGYSAGERVAAIGQALDLVDSLRAQGHALTYIDIGGGIPMSYLDDESQWEGFWREHRAGLLGEREPLTFGGEGLGLLAHEGEIIGEPAVYPFHQKLIRGEWLREVLSAQLPGERGTVAEGLRARDLGLRCEPGRSLLDGCGATAARVCHRKQRADGVWLIGVEMNRTQCRSTSADFMVDPLLVRPGEGAGGEGTGPIEGYLVGAYCIERELLTWRRLIFPEGVEVGDIVVFPNTAGYLMHILESASHQIPLAKNLIVAEGAEPRLDPIDSETAAG